MLEAYKRLSQILRQNFSAQRQQPLRAMKTILAPFAALAAALTVSVSALAPLERLLGIERTSGQEAA